MFEAFESRRHFSVTAATIHETLYVWGDANANGISVERSNDQLLVKVYNGADYVTMFQAPNSDVDRIRMYGYDGADTLTVSNNVSRPVVIMGGRGGDYIKGGGGNSQLFGQGDWSDDPSGSHNPSNDDNAIDNLVSGSGRTTLRGQGGNDQFYCNQAYSIDRQDLAYGGAGNDTFYLGGSRSVIARGEGGSDTFMPSGYAPMRFIGGGGGDTVDFRNFPDGVFARNDGDTKCGTLNNAFSGYRRMKINPDVETLKGTDERDSMVNVSAAGNLYGRGDFDSLYGQDGRNFIDGGSGGDYIYGGAESDTIFGGLGDDTIKAESGNDYVYGDNGKDSLLGGSGNDVLNGGNHDDVLEGGTGNDTLYGQAGGDHLHGDAGNNLLVGGTGSDYLVSQNGGFSDSLFGDNLNGTGSSGAFDIALIDKVFYNGAFLQDASQQVEFVTA